MSGDAAVTVEAELVARQADEDGYNARQAADRIKGMQTIGIDPEYPEEVGNDSEHIVTIYCDGSTKIPKQPMWSYGGFGVWAPNRNNRINNTGPDTGVALMQSDSHGVALWSKGPTDRCNSTRMELMAIAAGLTLPFRVHIKSDNMAVVNKTQHLVDTACRWNQCTDTDFWPGAGPYKRPWELQKDGDLWRLVWNAILTRGADTVQTTWIKGHATDEWVSQGQTLPAITDVPQATCSED